MGQEKITITNDKGRLSKEDIERMVADAEKYKDDDVKQKRTDFGQKWTRVLLFQYEGHCRRSEADRQLIAEKCNEVLNWLESNQTAELDEFKDKQKEVEDVCNPIITKLYQQAGGQPGSCGAQSGQGFGGQSGLLKK